MEDAAIIGLVVEGHGEVQALPILIRKFAQAYGVQSAIKCSVRRVPKSQLVIPGELERAVEALTRQIGRTRPILVLLDADNDCPRSLATSLSARCSLMHADVAIAVVLAKREYEAWFLAAAQSLAGRGGLASLA